MKRVGTITFNGQPASKHLKRHIGFVMQVRPRLPAKLSMVVLTSSH